MPKIESKIKKEKIKIDEYEVVIKMYNNVSNDDKKLSILYFLLKKQSKKSKEILNNIKNIQFRNVLENASCKVKNNIRENVYFKNILIKWLFEKYYELSELEQSNIHGLLDIPNTSKDLTTDLIDSNLKTVNEKMELFGLDKDKVNEIKENICRVLELDNDVGKVFKVLLEIRFWLEYNQLKYLNYNLENLKILIITIFMKYNLTSKLYLLKINEIDFIKIISNSEKIIEDFLSKWLLANIVIS